MSSSTLTLWSKFFTTFQDLGSFQEIFNSLQVSTNEQECQQGLEYEKILEEGWLGFNPQKWTSQRNLRAAFNWRARESKILIIVPACPKYGRPVSELERLQYDECFFRAVDKAVSDGIGVHFGAPSPEKGRRGHQCGLVSPPAFRSSLPEHMMDRPQIILAQW